MPAPPFAGQALGGHDERTFIATPSLQVDHGCRQGREMEDITMKEPFLDDLSSPEPSPGGEQPLRTVPVWVLPFSRRSSSSN